MVDLGRRRPALQDRHLHGQDRPDGADPQTAVDDPGADGDARASGHAALTVFGYDHAPHGHAEVDFENVRVPVANMLLGEGRGFEIAQGRLGPGPHSSLHATDRRGRTRARNACASARRCARGIRQAAAEQGVIRSEIAESRIEIDQARLLVLKAAYMMDTVGKQSGAAEIAMIKVVAPNMALRVLDWAIQVHGGGGVSDDFPLAAAWAGARTLRLADGPDEVHREQIGKLELSRYRPKGQAPSS